MSIFAVIPTDQLPGVRDRIGVSGLQHFRLPQGEFLVSFNGTCTELSEFLGITGGISGNALVVSVSSYYGRTTPDTWEWMTKNWGG